MLFLQITISEGEGNMYIVKVMYSQGHVHVPFLVMSMLGCNVLFHYGHMAAKCLHPHEDRK